MDNNFVICSGTSGTGKGTRVVQLIEFLKTRESPEVVTAPHKNKTKKVGLLFKSFNILFLGDYVVSNKSGLRSWSSMDLVHSTFGGADGARAVIEQVRGLAKTIVLEGEPMMLSHRWRPEYLFDDVQGLRAHNIMLNYYVYPEDAREAYDERIMGRSGKLAGDSGWSRNAGYHREYTKSLEELDKISEVLLLHKAFINKRMFDERLSALGADILSFAGLSSLVEPFEKFTESKPMLRSVKDKLNPLATGKRLW